MREHLVEQVGARATAARQHPLSDTLEARRERKYATQQAQLASVEHERLGSENNAIMNTSLYTVLFMVSTGFPSVKRKDIDRIIRAAKENSTITCACSVHRCTTGLQAKHTPLIGLGIVDVNHCAAFSCATYVWCRCRNACTLLTSDPIIQRIT